MKAVSLVEKGWAGARQLSMDWVSKGGTLTHWVKGELAPETLKIITPYPGMRIRGVHPRFFRAAAFWALLSQPGLDLVIADNQKTRHWIRRMFPWLKDKICLVSEDAQGRLEILEKGSRVK